MAAEAEVIRLERVEILVQQPEVALIAVAILVVHRERVWANSLRGMLMAERTLRLLNAPHSKSPVASKSQWGLRVKT